MDHSEALATQAAEKYLLRELSEEEQSAFEEHYFACQECASDLEAGALFVRHARAVFRENPAGNAAAGAAAPDPARHGKEREFTLWGAIADFFRQPLFPRLSAAALGAVCIYQGAVVIPDLKRSMGSLTSAQPLASYQLFQAVRGDEKTISVPSGAAFFALSFDVTWDSGDSHYRCNLADSGGQSRFSIRAPAPAAGQPISILVPARGFESGSYRLTVTPAEAAGGGAPLATYEFNLKLE